jgi:hypothetical protein
MMMKMMMKMMMMTKKMNQTRISDYIPEYPDYQE